MKRKNIDTLEDYSSLAKEIAASSENHKHIALYGGMGVGKTTMIKQVCKHLGVNEDEVTSPTFSIVNEYLSSQGETIYHFDFYRIEDERELLDIGYEEYFDSGNLCLIEWPERVEGLLPEGTLIVTMELKKDYSREIHIKEME